MSLVTHMTLLVIVGALTTAHGAGGFRGPIVLRLSLAEGDEDANSSPVATMVVQDQPQDDQARSETEIDTDAEREPVQVPQIDDHPQIQQQAREKPARTTIVPQVRPTLLAREFDAREPFQFNRPPNKRLTQSPAQREMDDVVDQFIQYDIGQLRGQAGAQARRDFQRLGPEAIPALVRGLNKAAKMRASCPIGVISHRLNELLKQTHDSSLIRYVLDNLGRGVTSTDPHYRVIQSTVKRWRQYLEPRYDRATRDLAQRRGKWWMTDEWRQTRSDSRVGSDVQRGFGSMTRPQPRGGPSTSHSAQPTKPWDTPGFLAPRPQPLPTRPTVDYPAPGRSDPFPQVRPSGRAGLGANSRTPPIGPYRQGL